VSDVEETAKATQEVAKTVSNALDKSEKFGGFITKYFGTTLEQSVEIFNDKLKYRRWENQINLMLKAEAKLKKLNLEKPPKELTLKLGLPLLEAASLEDDDYLQNLWANLLVNCTADFSLERSYISILEQLSPLEARILVEIYSNFTFEVNTAYAIDTLCLPYAIKIEQITKTNGSNIILVDTIKNTDKNKIVNNYDVYLALINLSRLNCIEGTATHGAGTYFGRVNPTYLGVKLYEAVKEPTI